jgi:hypothetical protein
MPAENVSLPYRPDPAKCCEACAFGGGHHALWCPEGKAAAAVRDGAAHRDDFLKSVIFSPAEALAASVDYWAKEKLRNHEEYWRLGHEEV